MLDKAWTSLPLFYSNFNAKICVLIAIASSAFMHLTAHWTLTSLQFLLVLGKYLL